MSTYTTAGSYVWLGKSRIVCDADTPEMAIYIANALNMKAAVDKQGTPK